MSPRDAAFHVLHQLREAGHTAYFAGGCVRDLLLRLTPKDYDIATSAPPDAVRQLFRNTQAVGAAFGVILVRYAGHQIEVATFRSDVSYTDGRRPDAVRFATPQEDAQRRDFTINGLFLDPAPPSATDPGAAPADPLPPFGHIIDFVGGQADLAARILRAIGDPDRRFAEDHLRLLRAVRFAARFGLTLDPGTAAAIRRHAPHLRRIAPERVGDEVRRMLVPATRAHAWPLLRELGLTQELFRYVECVDRPSISLVHRLPARDLSMALVLSAAALEEAVDGPDDLLPALSPPRVTPLVRGLRRTLCLTNLESEAMAELLTTAHALLAAPPPPLSLLRRSLAKPTSADLMTLLHSLHAGGLLIPQLTPLLPRLDQLRQGDNAPPPLLTGDHLTAAGLQPGPLFRRLLEATYDAQLEGRLTTPDAALAHALALVPPGNSPRESQR